MVVAEYYGVGPLLHQLGERMISVYPMKFIVSVLLMIFALIDIIQVFQQIAVR